MEELNNPQINLATTLPGTPGGTFMRQFWPAFPPFPHRTTEGIIQVWNVEHVPCNYLQSFENSMDEVHVAFTHQPGGSHAKMSADLPLITAEETDWGMLRFGTRKSGMVRQT